jgi:RHS repeat-associated protein
MSGVPLSSPTQKYFLGEALWKKVQVGTTTYYLPGMRIENGVVRKMYGSYAERSAEDQQLRFYLRDQIGSSTLVTDQSGTVVRRQTFKPFGEDRNVAVSTFTPKYQFTGKEKEQDQSDFYDYGARIYNPATGRWLSADTTTDGLNRYTYVGNNPLGSTDPTGHTTVELNHPSNDPDFSVTVTAGSPLPKLNVPVAKATANMVMVPLHLAIEAAKQFVYFGSPYTPPTWNVPVFRPSNAEEAREMRKSDLGMQIIPVAGFEIGAEELLEELLPDVTYIASLRPRNVVWEMGLEAPGTNMNLLTHWGRRLFGTYNPHGGYVSTWKLFDDARLVSGFKPTHVYVVRPTGGIPVWDALGRKYPFVRDEVDLGEIVIPRRVAPDNVIGVYVDKENYCILNPNRAR